MNKAYLLIICLLLTSFTGCLDDFISEEVEITTDAVEGEDNSQVDESDNTEEETEERPTDHWTFYRDFVECDPNNDSIVSLR